jgi:hypothetical protein
MEDKREEKKEENYEIKAIGKDMAKLIEIVEEKFEKEYGFRPSIIDASNLIARRVMDAGLF